MLNFIGIGSAFNINEGNTSAYFKIDKDLYIFDMGEDVFSRLMKKEVFNDIVKVNIFITHLHSDHVGSLGTAIAYLYLIKFNQDNSKICVYFPSDAISIMLSLQGINKNWYTLFTNLWDNIPIDATRKKIEYSFELTEHTNDLNYKKQKLTFGIEFSIKDEFAFYYSGDTNEFKPQLKNIWNYDAIYHEVTTVENSQYHTPYTKLVEATKDFTKEQRKKIFLMHLDINFNKQKAIDDGFSIAKYVF